VLIHGDGGHRHNDTIRREPRSRRNVRDGERAADDDAPRLRKFMLTLHVTSSVGLLGAIRGLSGAPRSPA